MSGAVARRYAQAIFEIALDRDDLDRWRRDLDTIASVLDTPEMEQVIDNPKLSFAQKQELIRRVLGTIGPLALNFVFLLTDKGRLGVFDEIHAEFERLYNEHQGLEIAEVTTAVPLGDAEEDAIRRRLEAMTGKKIVLKTRVDPEIMGGLVARIGDRVVDGSVRSRLVALKTRLAAAGAI